MPKKKAHPADFADREAIAQAAGFNVHLRISPTKKINEPAASLAEAVKVADRIAADHPNRRPLIYAILSDDKTVPVPKDMWDAARQGSAKPAGRGASPKQKKAREKAEDGQKAAAKGRAEDKPTKPATGKRAAIPEAAKNGVLPPVPDFSAPTHARFRKKLDQVVAMVKAKDIDGLRAFEINPVSTSPKAIARYRDLALVALEASARPAA